MKLFSLNRVFLYGAFFVFLIFLFVAHLLSTLEVNELKKATIAQLYSTLNEMTFGLKKEIERNGLYSMQTYLDLASANHPMALEFSLLENETITQSSDQKLIGKKYPPMIHIENLTEDNLLHAHCITKPFEVLIANQSRNLSVGVRLDRNTIHQMHKDITFKVHFLLFFVILAISAIVWIFTNRSLIGEIKKLSASVKNKSFDEHIRIKELSALQKTYEKVFLELKTLNGELHQKVKEEVEKRRLSEAALIDQHKHSKINELMTNIAHHWRQPLTIISMGNYEMEMMIDEPSEANDKKRFTEILQLNNREIQNLSNLITEFTNIYSGDDSLSDLNLQNTLAQITQLFS